MSNITYFPNLASSYAPPEFTQNDKVLNELQVAGIHPIYLKNIIPNKEVRTNIVGIFGSFYDEKSIQSIFTKFSFTEKDLHKFTRLVFVRFWNYWVVDGVIPYEIAQHIHDSTEFEIRATIRPTGHCIYQSPDTCWTPFDHQFGSCKGIDGYHIDTFEGLTVFIAAIKKFGWDKPPYDKLILE